MHTKAVQISLTLLHSSGPPHSYKYPDEPVIITLPLTDIAIADNWKLEHIEFFVTIACFVLTMYSLLRVLMSFSVLALSCTSISPDLIVVLKQNLYHVKPDGEGSYLWKMEKI